MKHAIKHVHFVGIGGVGMSGIAEVLFNLGYRVSGSDLAESDVTRRLVISGVTVMQGHAAANIDGADVVVVSSAVASNNPEVSAAQVAKIPVVPRAVMLAELMRLKKGIAIAGTHGKTTTTSLMASVLAAGGLDPTFVIGGRLNSAGANARLGTGEYIVVEADESDASFLNLLPMIAVITNIDADHMDTYGHDFERLKQAFVDFTHHLPFYGAAVLCVDDAQVRSIMPGIMKPIITYGFSTDADVRAVNAEADGTAMKFIALRKDAPPLPVTLRQPGMHNVLNALAVIAVATELEVDDSAIQSGLESFGGVGRRFQQYGRQTTQGGARFTLIDDYGHHPVEMAATIAAARGAFPGRRIVLAFQPHRYSRTRDCFAQFVDVIGQADAVVLTEVYAAGESIIEGATGRALTAAVHAAGKVAPLFVPDIAAMPEAILSVAQDGDVVLNMGAGSIGGVPEKIVAALQKVAA
jgi:UDP-N-acetylmuramate--alanine ligase